MNREDILHYESYLVMKIAKSFVRKNIAWDEISATGRRRYIERALDVLCVLTNDDEAVARFKKLAEARNH